MLQILTHTNVVTGVGRFIRYVRYVCLCVCQHSKTNHWTSSPIGRLIVCDKCWSPILFKVKRLNVKVGVSLQSSECQSSRDRLSIVNKKSFKKLLDPDCDLGRHQNLSIVLWATSHSSKKFVKKH